MQLDLAMYLWTTSRMGGFPFAFIDTTHQGVSGRPHCPNEIADGESSHAPAAPHALQASIAVEQSAQADADVQSAMTETGCWE